MMSFVNEGHSKIYGKLVEISEDYFWKSASLTYLSSDNGLKALPSDFYKLRGVDLILDRNVTVRRFELNNRNDYNQVDRFRVWGGRQPVWYRVVGGNLEIIPHDRAPGDYTLWYVPRKTDLAPAVGTVGGVKYEHIRDGEAGSGVTVAHSGGGSGDTASVSVSGTAITVTIDAAATKKTTVADAVNAHVDARQLVYAEAAFPSDGLATSAVATALAGEVTMDANIPDGFEDYVVLYAAILAKQKGEEDHGTLSALIRDAESKIDGLAKNRDAAMPKVVPDVDDIGNWY